MGDYIDTNMTILTETENTSIDNIDWTSEPEDLYDAYTDPLEDDLENTEEVN